MTKASDGPTDGPAVGRAEQARRGKDLLLAVGAPPADFGRDDRPKCERCGADTHLTRRRPHPTRGSRYELQSFTCSKCGRVQFRDADSHGAL